MREPSTVLQQTLWVIVTIRCDLPNAATSPKEASFGKTEFSRSVISSQTSKHEVQTSSAAPQTAFELLLACCRSETGAKQSLHKQFAPPAPQWEALMRLAEQHDLIPLLYRNVSTFPDLVSSAVLEALRLSYQRNAQKNLRLTHELIRIVDCLQSQGVAALPYKGPVLAQAIYDDIGMRQFSDLDILIRPCDVPRAKAAIAQLGYTPSTRMTEAEEQAYLRSGYELGFDGPFGRNLLELQWRILPRFYCVDLSVESLFERASEIAVGGRIVKTLSPEDLVLVLCIHAAKHAWARLSFLVDIAGAARSQNINYELLEKRARRLRIERILGVNFWLLHELLAMPLPMILASYIRGDRSIEVLARKIQCRLSDYSEYDTGLSDYFRLMLALRERSWDKLRFLARLALTPGRSEWATVRLPRPLFPMYPTIRLYRLAGKLFRRLL